MPADQLRLPADGQRQDAHLPLPAEPVAGRRDVAAPAAAARRVPLGHRGADPHRLRDPAADVAWLHHLPPARLPQRRLRSVHRLRRRLPDRGQRVHLFRPLVAHLSHVLRQNRRLLSVRGADSVGLARHNSRSPRGDIRNFDFLNRDMSIIDVVLVAITKVWVGRLSIEKKVTVRYMLE